MGDRDHNRHGLKRGGLLCPFRGELGPRLIQWVRSSLAKTKVLDKTLV